MPPSHPSGAARDGASLTSEEFLAAVMETRPRLAVFDCDGTLWSPDSGEGFLYWGLERGLFSSATAAWARARYQEYRDGRVGEEQMCGEMVAIHEGIELEKLEREAALFFETKIERAIFPEMIELTARLRESGCEMWAVSSTNDWVVRAGVRRFGIPPEHVLAARVHVEDGVATGRLARVPSGPDKAIVVREVVGRVPDVCFGNSIHDLQLLECARRPFAVNPNPDLETIARERRWPVYWPAR